MKFVSSAIRVSAVLLLATAGLGGGCAVASPNPPTSPPGTSPIDQYVQSQGSAFIANQQRLSDFKHWIVTQPGIEAAGYVEQVNDAATLSTKLLWKKGQSHLRDVVLAEATARGITATFGDRPYSLPEIRAAIKKIDAKKGAMAAAGFQVDTIVGVRDDNGAIAVEGHAVNAAPASGEATSGAVVNGASAPVLASVSSIAAAASGTAVRVVDKRKVTAATATRDNDTSPFNAGGYMTENLQTCSTGFALKDSLRTYTITARHCLQGNYYDRDNTSTFVGRETRDSPDGQATIMSGYGSQWMFDGTWNNSAGYSKAVSGFQDVSLGDSVCTSGGNSGVHCTIKVISTSVSWNDGYGAALNIEGLQQTAGAIAVITGDSGGPVLMPRSDGTVGAVGMIQAAPGADRNNCGSVRDPLNDCSPYVLFTSTRTIANSLGMSLVTR